MTRIIAVFVLVAALGGAVGWYAYSRPVADEPTQPARIAHVFPLVVPAGATLEKPAIAIDAQGRVLVAWAVDTAESERTLFLARSTDGGTTFGAPSVFRKIAVLRHKATQRGKEVARSTHVQPRLAATGATFVLGWTEPVDKDRTDYLVARSEDGGQSFTPPVRANRASAARPGYTGLAAAANGTVGTTWLDRQSSGQQPFCALCRPAGSFTAEQLVYAGPAEHGICPCCDVDLTLDTDGTTYVAFRNNDEDIRDVFVARARAGAAFEPPVPVSAHGWHLVGCPHDGPALAISDGRLHVAWMDAHTGESRVYWAHSALDRLAFVTVPLDTQSTGAQGHPRLAAGGGFVHAVWDSSLSAEPADHGHNHGAAITGKGHVVRYARWAGSADGPTASRALDAQGGVHQLNPAIAVGPSGDALVAWIEFAGEAPSVAVCRVAAQ